MKGKAIFSLLYAIVLLLGFACYSSAANHVDNIWRSNRILRDIQRQYGLEARERVIQWKRLIETNQSATDAEKLDRVNQFFNQFDFVDDSIHWGMTDYWATPLETLVTNGGDCEDFTLAKYLTLRSLEVPETRMRLSYVKSLTLNQPHMVLAYYPTADSEPLLLDNLVTTVQPASSRPDLIPVYSFNGRGLWLTKQRRREEKVEIYVGSDRQLGLWQEFLQRLHTEQERDWGFISPALAAPPPR